MGSVLDKVRIGVLANLNKLLDKVVNTPEGYKQYIRDLEESLAELRSADDEVVGTGNGYQRQIVQLNSKKAELQSDIDLMLGDDDPENDSAAVQLQLQLQQCDNQIADLQELVTANSATKAKLDEAISKLEQRHQKMVGELNHFTMMQAATAAQNRASSAAEEAAKVSDATAGASVDSIDRSLGHAKDVSDARFTRVFDDLASSASPEEAAELARAKQAIDERRTAIAQQATATHEPATV